MSVDTGTLQLSVLVSLTLLNRRICLIRFMS
jgi:hypothetical protein